MRVDIGLKLGAMILLLAILSSGLAAFALYEADREQDRYAQMQTISDLAVRAETMIELVQSVVIDADAVTIAADKAEAELKLIALRTALLNLHDAEQPFFDAIGARLSSDRKVALSLRLKEFEDYQTDTANLGLTVSPQAAQIQASDPATVSNRQSMVRDFHAISRELFEAAGRERAALVEARQHARTLLIAVPAITILFGFLASAWIVRTQIQTPLIRLRRSMQTLAKGHLDIEIPYVFKHDEVGDMAASIAIFQAALRANRESDERLRQHSLGDLRRAETIVQSTQRFEGIAVNLMRELSASVAAMDSGASAVATSSNETQDEATIV